LPGINPWFDASVMVATGFDEPPDTTKPWPLAVRALPALPQPRAARLSPIQIARWMPGGVVAGGGLVAGGVVAGGCGGSVTWIVSGGEAGGGVCDGGAVLEVPVELPLDGAEVGSTAAAAGVAPAPPPQPIIDTSTNPTANALSFFISPDLNVSCFGHPTVIVAAYRLPLRAEIDARADNL
jgi:hypothetical protein